MADNKRLENLAKIYLSAREQLLNTIVNYHGVGTKVYANTIYKKLQQEIKKLEKETNGYISSEIPKEYKKGLKEVYDYFKKNKLQMKAPQVFADIHYGAIYELAREMQYQIQDGLAQAGRQIIRYIDTARDEALRAAGLAATGEKFASGSTVLQMKNNLIKKLQNEGFMSVRYGTGPDAYQVPIDAYAMMVARSTTREAGNLARMNQLTENGYDLVEMTEHYPTCDVCAMYQGKVYSISGEDKRFHALSVAFSEGYNNVHPNCRHSVHPWIESMHTEEEVQQAIEKSNQPLEDNRTKEEIDLYKKQQSANRTMRQNQYQYERYVERLGEDAPKNFNQFLGTKAYEEKWKELSSFYRHKGKFPNITLEDYSKNIKLADAKSKILDTLPKTLKLTSDYLPNTMDVANSKVKGVIPQGAELTGVRLIAGKGVSTELRDRYQLSNLYGGLPEEWEKKGAIAVGKYFNYDIHWYENNGNKPFPTFKIKGVKEVES